jgi:hypothetical protein
MGFLMNINACFCVHTLMAKSVHNVTPYETVKIQNEVC